jgi:hypothetical protein
MTNHGFNSLLLGSESRRWCVCLLVSFPIRFARGGKIIDRSCSDWARAWRQGRHTVGIPQPSCPDRAVSLRDGSHGRLHGDRFFSLFLSHLFVKERLFVQMWYLRRRGSSGMIRFRRRYVLVQVAGLRDLVAGWRWRRDRWSDLFRHRSGTAGDFAPLLF